MAKPARQPRQRERQVQVRHGVLFAPTRARMQTPQTPCPAHRSAAPRRRGPTAWRRPAAPPPASPWPPGTRGSRGSPACLAGAKGLPRGRAAAGVRKLGEAPARGPAGWLPAWGDGWDAPAGLQPPSPAMRTTCISPTNRMTAGAAATMNMLRHADIGSATLTSSAPRMPRQIISWLRDPRVPRTLVGATWGGRGREGGAAWLWRVLLTMQAPTPAPQRSAVPHASPPRPMTRTAPLKCTAAPAPS